MTRIAAKHLDFAHQARLICGDNWLNVCQRLADTSELQRLREITFGTDSAAPIQRAAQLGTSSCWPVRL